MGLKSVLKRMLIGPLGYGPRRVPRGLLRGLWFHINTEGKASRLLGTDEREIADVTRRYAGRAKSALDIGSNDGWYALYFASRPNIDKVIAFEPDPKLTDKAQENFKLNSPGFLAKTQFVNKFVGSQDDEKWMSLDKLLPTLPAPVLLKIDVDDAEMQVLQGGADALRRGDHLLVIETHSVELEKQCAAFLQSLGYKTRIIPPAWYRVFLPENRQIEHNQWLSAEKA